MFSPYYAWSGRSDPLNHCALNVAIYGERSRRWAMTERGCGAVLRTAHRLDLGPSALAWDDDGLTITVDEVGAPVPARIRGRIRVNPRFLNATDYCLDPAGGHFWRPIAPAARVEVDLAAPAACWRGAGYFDSNWGAGPLEESFVRWDWSRAALGDGAALLYDLARRDGEAVSLAVRFDGSGAAEAFAPPPPAALPSTPIWRIPRRTRSEASPAVVARTLEDTPFYARSVVVTQLFGERAVSMHESLSLDRFATRWVKALLPFKMPRAVALRGARRNI